MGSFTRKGAVAVGLIGLLALIVMLVLLNVLQGKPIMVDIVNDATPTPPQPTPQITVCHQGANLTGSINERCRRLAVHQAIYPNPTPSLAQGKPPLFDAATFRRIDSYSLHSKSIRLPHCEAWNVTRDSTTGYPTRLSDLPVINEPEEYAYFVYATPADFPDLRSFRVSGINVASVTMGAIQIQPNSTINIGAVTTTTVSKTPNPPQTQTPPNATPTYPTTTVVTPIPYKYWRSAVPWNCQAIGGTVVDVEP